MIAEESEIAQRDSISDMGDGVPFSYLCTKIYPMPWPANPLIFEINTWTWLNALSRSYNRHVTLASIPAAEYDKLARQGFDAVWFMGVWERSPAGIAIARQHPGIMKDMHDALPDFSESDLAGSPYCIRRYRVESILGGAEGLAIARRELARRGIRLILDFVPNHVAPDHPWTYEHPEFFVRGTEVDLASRPDDYLESNNHIYARARDPFFPPWPDILQLNLFDQGLRDAMATTIKDIAGQSDGVRCDMAMLVMNDIFRRVWGENAGTDPGVDFWNFIIPAVKKDYPDFIFIAEVYWEKEKEMLDQGFDFAYDKRLYDRIKEGAQPTLHHLQEIRELEGRLLRFLENHDEPRAAHLFAPERSKALALAALTLPGARLIHDGQMEGKKIKVPVFLGRASQEDPDPELSDFYRRLLKLLEMESLRVGMESHTPGMESLETIHWALCNISGWPDNQSCQNLLAWEWHSEDERVLIVVNLSDHPAQALIKSMHPYPLGRTFQMTDVISGKAYERNGDELNSTGLFVDLKGWGMHALMLTVGSQQSSVGSR